jgi:hypothetical protein
MLYLKPNPELYNVPSKIADFHGMPYRQLGKSGLRASAVGLGTWKYGYPETGDGARVNEKQAMEIFDRAWELGVALWDTANRYNAASGNSERLIGQWFRNNPEKRRDIVLATKVWGGMDGRTPNHWGLSRANIIDSVHACLERLRIDYMDLLYFHRPDPLIGLDESLLAVKPAMRWVAKISHVKTLHKAREISYGGTFVTKKETVVATIPVGYADGYPRCLSNIGEVLVRGKRAPIIGRICMDQFMIDVTDIPGVELGTEVTLVGRDGDECLSMEEVSEKAYSFNYELPCRISRRVPRLYYKKGKEVVSLHYLID